MQDLVKLTVKNPAKTIGLELGKIEVGTKADFVLFDTSKIYTVKNQQSLYNGETLFGEVRAIF
jgi:dihydroorotase